MQRKSWIGGVFLLALVCSACGSDEVPTEASRPAPTPIFSADNTPPVLERIRFEPASPVSGQMVRAVVVARDPQGDRVELGYVWRIDGITRRSGSPEIELEGVPRGATLEVEVTASDGNAQVEGRAEAVVVDRPPVLVGLEVTPPRTVAPGEVVSASGLARDPDGDLVHFEYAWFVNDQERGSGSTLSTEGLRKDDEIRVRVWARDGANRSEPLTSAPVMVGSTHPEILSMPPDFRDDGIFHYEVSVEDPDGDRLLRFQLASAPAGMTIDEISGEVTWRPTHEQTGVHPVAIVVRDSTGLETTQSFDVTVGEAAPPAAASGG